MTGWSQFWLNFWTTLLSPATARFILALASIGVGFYALEALMTKRVEPTNREALFMALGIMLGLAKDAYSYYFGSTARGDDKPVDVHVANERKDPIPVEGPKSEKTTDDGNQSADFTYKELPK